MKIIALATASGCVNQKILQHRVAVFRQYRLRVKLHAFNGQGFVAHTHHFAVVCSQNSFMHGVIQRCNPLIL